MVPRYIVACIPRLARWVVGRTALAVNQAMLALIHRCVAHCREQGAGPIVIAATASDTPKEMCAAMGFRPVAVKREYGKGVRG